MELLLKGRGARVTDPLRKAAAAKLAKLARLDPRVVRIELEVISERNPRLNGTKRLEAAVDLPRHTFRARAEAPDAEVALDILVERLERQIRDHHSKRRNRSPAGGSRLESPRTRPEGTGPAT
jgi:ribosomal subunit interface protein